MPSTARNAAPPAQHERMRLALADFDAIYEEMVGYVWNVVAHMGVHPSDAEDVVQEVFVTVYRRLGEFEGRARLKTWVFRIAVHLVQHYFRTHVRKPGDRATVKGTEIHVLADQRENGPASHVERMERYDALDRVLAELDEAKRLVFVLAELEEMTLSEESARFVEQTPTPSRPDCARLGKHSKRRWRAFKRGNWGGRDDERARTGSSRVRRVAPEGQVAA